VSVLLDTRVLLWLLDGQTARFGSGTEEILRDGAVAVSAASIWEIAIKRSLGTLSAPPGLLDTLTAAGVQMLPVTAAHAERVAELADLHRDPFERMLVAQATIEKLTIMTANQRISSYPVPTHDPAS
jgi:PIN domain nuclease of toxin-antitoxin system